MLSVNCVHVFDDSVSGTGSKNKALTRSLLIWTEEKSTKKQFSIPIAVLASFAAVRLLCYFTGEEKEKVRAK
uniref:Uncharacterized protein n=1 Tax=Wuchereria bancrofti TaxID=6293 RepID=A0AAF5PZQ7_WUCBA